MLQPIAIQQRSAMQPAQQQCEPVDGVPVQLALAPVQTAPVQSGEVPAGEAQPGEPAASPAALPRQLEALVAACDACRRCPLGLARTQVVVSRGNPAARLMVIGEGPGAQEDARGLPFVGRAGQLLDQMLEIVGIDSNRDAYVCNVVKCRPPENRKPSGLEMAACLPWLQHQVALVNPAVILLAGATALEGVLGVKGGITKLRGQWRQGSEAWLEGRWLMPIFHPSFLLRHPSRERGSPKWLTWHDLQDVKRRLELE